MIDVKEALNQVVNNAGLLPVDTMNLADAQGYYLSADVLSPMAMPPFDRSAMDGYAISGNKEIYTVVGEVKAGDTKSVDINEGEATRIFTGGLVPNGATAVAKQEIVKEVDNGIMLEEAVKTGANIRLEGEEVTPGQTILKSGTKLNAAAVGLLAGLGISTVEVYKKPIVNLVVTGSELVKPGNSLKRGQIYESNAIMLKAALANLGLDAKMTYVEDDYSATKSCIETALSTGDFVILTGGISVGDYDFVGKALNELGVREIFYKVRQKPGKPLYFGKYNSVNVFALPGNPAAALTCFYMYVIPALKTVSGCQNSLLKQRQVRLIHDYEKSGGRAHLLKARVTNGQIEVHNGQSSAMLSTFVDANCFLFLSEAQQQLKRGDVVEAYMLPE